MVITLYKNSNIFTIISIDNLEKDIILHSSYS